MKLFWMFLSGVFAVVAVIFFARDDYDKAFVCAAVGAVLWFLRYRAQMKELVQSNEPAEDGNESLNIDDEE